MVTSIFALSVFSIYSSAYDTILLLGNISLTSDKSEYTVGDTAELTAKLEVIYDSQTVDLKGVLQNATVKFYEGNTLIYTTTTNVTGEAFCDYSFVEMGDYSFSVEFEGTELFDDATSNNVDVTVEEASNSVTLLNRQKGAYAPLDAYITLNGETKRCYSEEYGEITFDNVPDGEYEVTAYFDILEYVPQTIVVDWEHRTFELYWEFKS